MRIQIFSCRYHSVTDQSQIFNYKYSNAYKNGCKRKTMQSPCFTAVVTCAALLRSLGAMHDNYRSQSDQLSIKCTDQVQGNVDTFPDDMAEPTPYQIYPRFFGTLLQFRSCITSILTDLAYLKSINHRLYFRYTARLHSHLYCCQKLLESVL